MYTAYVQVGAHYLFIDTADEQTMEWLLAQFKSVQPERWDEFLPDLYITIQSGYGKPLNHMEVRVSKERGRIYYERDDYWLETDEHYRRALLKVHDHFSLKHALMTIYSAFIVHHRWGMMIHSSCIVDDGKAFLFAGYSGAGKSTVAMLSKPRVILSDEASLVRIEDDGVYVYDSPFRSDIAPEFDAKPLPLAGVHILEQATHIERNRIQSSEAMIRLMDKIFYWAVEPAETIKILSMCGKLVELVPTYNLLFQKNDLFWERIS